MGKYKFTTQEVLKIIGIKRNRLQAWKLAGFISPTYPAESQGCHDYWTIVDIYKIELFRRLLKAGISRNTSSFANLEGSLKTTHKILRVHTGIRGITIFANLKSIIRKIDKKIDTL